MVGMILVLVVVGNIVLLKFVEDIFYIVYKLMEILEEVGLLKGVVNFVFGDLKEIGDYLVDYKDMYFVIFIGLCVIGIRIYECSVVV